MLSVGQILQQARLKKGYPLSLIEKQIKVREKFLRAIEENNWKFFSSKIYITGIIKNYSTFLGLDHKKILSFFRREYESKDDVRFQRKVSSLYLISDTRWVIIGIFIAISLLFLSYFGYQVSLYISPPKVVIIEPMQSVFKRIDKVKIVGKTEKEAAVTIFGERVYQNKEGIFEYDYPLKEGKNVLVIEIIGANGKKTILRKEFIREQ
ncbi:helix-turn-helix domain-containing protein [Candidatus Roizmanbacteria bacterium]|nr:helix-turn-helix domain-containing protein [Candidatus Roizmanbacteria bacterium]